MIKKYSMVSCIITKGRGITAQACAVDICKTLFTRHVNSVAHTNIQTKACEKTYTRSNHPKNHSPDGEGILSS